MVEGTRIVRAEVGYGALKNPSPTLVTAVTAQRLAMFHFRSERGYSSNIILDVFATPGERAWIRQSSSITQSLPRNSRSIKSTSVIPNCISRTSGRSEEHTSELQ